MTPRPSVEIETSELRRRVRTAIEKSRQAAAARRERVERASAAYDDLLEHTAIPLARRLVNVLKAEGVQFTLHTPKGGLRLASAAPDDFLELALDTSQAEPVVLLHASRTRGRRTLHHERPLKPGAPVEAIGEEDLLAALLDELGPFVER